MSDEKIIPLSKGRVNLLRACIGKMFDDQLVLTRQDAEQLLDAVERKLDQDKIIEFFGGYLDRVSGFSDLRPENQGMVSIGDVIGAWDVAREQKAK